LLAFLSQLEADPLIGSGRENERTRAGRHAHNQPDSADK
jgi:hypothetical protein